MLIAENKFKGAILRTLAHRGKRHTRKMGAQPTNTRVITSKTAVLGRFFGCKATKTLSKR